MRRILVLLASFLLFSILAAGQAPTRIAIRAGKLIDARSEKPLENPLIQVEGDKIVSVTAGGSAPAGVEVVDLGNATVLPGFIDVHTHLLLQGDVTSEEYDAQLLKQSIPYRAILAARNAQIALSHGFTAMRDLETEGAMYADVDVKQAIANAEVPGAADAGGHAGHVADRDVSAARLLMGTEVAYGCGVRRRRRRRAQSGTRTGNVRSGLDQVLLRPA